MNTFIWLAVTIILIKHIVAVQFNILNRDPEDIWLGVVPNSEKPVLNNGGFVLHAGETISIEAPEYWSGRFWARTWCNPDTQHCDTGDCGNGIECNGASATPPGTLIEVTLNGHEDADYYDVSLIDGFNIKATIEPVADQQNGVGYACKIAACVVNINDGCPERLQVRSANGIIACKADCTGDKNYFNCCRGAYGIPGSCPETQSAQYFKSQCPDAYSYISDDDTGTFACNAAVYNIAFGG